MDSQDNRADTSETMPRMVVLRPDGKAAAGEQESRCFPSWNDLQIAAMVPLGFFLDGWQAPDAVELTRQIRQSAWWHLPVWVGGGAAPPLADGAGSYAQAREAGDRALAARRSLAIDPAGLYFDERVLYFLYVRHDAELVPLLDRNSSTLYRYATVDALARDHEDPDTCLATLMRRRLLEPSSLLDRTRHCRACGSAHIHYLDVCPHCHSLQIRKAQSLHCFACGHVGAEDLYHDDGRMACPKCHATLRHIGVDYDRPLTQYACGSCRHVFVDTEVVARCLDCQSKCAPDALDVREIASLRLSAQGRAALRGSQIRETFAALDTVNYVEPAFFRRLIDWALASQQRHHPIAFDLMLVEFDGTAALIEQIGSARVFLLLDEFAKRLNELLRDADVTTRTQEERLWLFLPWSSAAGLAARLEGALAELAAADARASLKAHIRFLQAPNDVRTGETSARLLGRLEKGG